MISYCINLDRRPDRLEHMNAEFGRVGVSFQRISAANGQGPEAMAIAASMAPQADVRRISANAVACTLSHRTIWRLLLDGADEYAAVFEDDVIVAPDLHDVLRSDWVPDDADVVRLETWHSRIHVSLTGHRKGPGGRLLKPLRSAHLGTAGYIVSRRGAEKLLRGSEAFNVSTDRMMFDPDIGLLAQLKVYQMVPGPVIQGDRALVNGLSDLLQNQSSWMKTSIVDRYDNASNKKLGETAIQRLSRRVRETVKGVRQGTSYEVVRFG